MNPSNPTIKVVRLKTFNLPGLIGSFVSLAGFVILLEWTFGIKIIALLSPTDSSMKSNTAFVFLCFGLSLLFHQSNKDFVQKTAVILAIIGLLIAGLTLSQYIFGINLGFDELIFKDHPNPDITSHPGRMSPLVAFNFLLTGSALLFWRRFTKNQKRPSEFLGLIAIIIPFIVTLGYLFNATSLYSFTSVTGVALITAILFLIIEIGILAIHSEQGLTTILLSNTRGGLVLRFLLPTILAAIILFDWLIWKASQLGLFPQNLVVSLGTILSGIAISVLIWRSAKLLYFTDIKEKESFEKLQTAYQTAEEANRSKDEFISIVSHELRTPLNTIMGWMQIIKMNPSEENMRRALEVVKRQSENQLKLVEDLLDTSRIISGKMRLELAPLQIDHIIAEALESIRPAATAKNIEVNFNINSEVKVMQGDGGRLLQVFWNLLSNSVKFTPNGGMIKIDLFEKDNQHLEITIADTGKGIEADLLPFVFDRFRQSENSTSRRTSGLGLGLSLVRNLIELHGGSISVRSEGIGKGSTFTILLPIYEIE